MKERDVGATLVEDTIMEVLFKDIKKYVLVELARYIRNHMVEASRRKYSLNAWVVKFLKGNSIAISHLYHAKYIDRFYRL